MNWKAMLASALLVVAFFVAARICEDEAQPKTEASQTTFSAGVPAKTETVVEKAVIPCSTEKACPKGFACNLTSYTCVLVAKQPVPDKNDPVAGDVDKLW